MLRFNHNSRIFKTATAITWMLSSSYGYSQVCQVDTLMKNGERANRINLVYLSDGYTAGQINNFSSDAATINNALFSQAPFAQYKNFFNAYTIKTISPQSGAKHPGIAADENSSGGQPFANPDNFYKSTFDYFSIHRLLVPQDDNAIYDVLANNLPDYDQAFIVVNSPYYGGSGGAYATASIDPSSAEVAIHEIGHSFAGLADEYWAGDYYAAEKPNMTANNNPGSNKWSKWIGTDGVGIFPYGPTGSQNAWYRPHETCKMQYLGNPFCSVCTERFVDRIHQLVDMIDDHLPSTTSFALTNNSNEEFSITNVLDAPSTMTVQWFLNGNATPMASGVSSVSLPYSSFEMGNNTITAEVTDNTVLSKTYMPMGGYVSSVTWNVSKSQVLAIGLSAFAGKINDQQQADLSWEISTPGDVSGFDLERSLDGSDFKKIISIAAEPSKIVYSYTDRKMPLPFAYYRLLSKEIDGTMKYSNVIRLSDPLDKFSYKLYQDPEARRYHLNCTLATSGKIVAVISDIKGTVLAKRDYGTVTNRLDDDFDLQKLAAGIYIMKLYINNTIHSIKIVAK